jgi:hypothetical protein
MTCPPGYIGQFFTVKEKGNNLNIFACLEG